MNTIKKDKFAADLFAAFEAGKNSYMRIDRLESSNFDMTWIKAIEDCIYELGEIVANPKEVTKTVTGIVPVELARKTGAESVQHLASHTQYIKEITEDGDVVPNKILNIGSEEDIHTYENRFIATLIRRLVLFIEKRYEFIRNFSTLHDEEILFFKSKAIVDGAEVEIETKVKVRSESDSDAANKSNAYVNRILKLREYIMYFYGSKFMKELKTERDVRNPIVMTNILRKNPKYHKCYELYRFIEKYDKLGVSYKLDEDASIFSAEELSELNTVMFTNYLALKARDRSKTTKGFSRTYKPRILTSIDDEEFIYGDLLRGPIEFVRIDEGYQQYLDEQLKQDLPPHPTNLEKEYYEEEITAKNTRKSGKAAIDKLVKRKKKAKADFERQARDIIAQREREEQERIDREAEANRREEERKIEEVRQALIRDALFGNDANTEIEEGSSTPLEVEIPVEEPTEEPVEEEVVPVEEPQEPEELPETLEEEQSEESVIDEPETVEEVPQEEPVPEEVVSSEPETIEPEVIEEESQPQEDVESIRQQLVEDALSEEEAVVEEEQIEEEPEVLEDVQTAEEEQQEEIAEEIVEAPAEEVTESESEIVEETPVQEENQQSEEQPVEIIEEPSPVEEIAPVEEAVEENPVEESQEEVQSEENNEISIEEPVSAVKKPVKKRKKKKKVVKKAVEEPVKIPGRFIVKTAEGYFVNPHKYSVYKHEAHVFDDFNEANRIKNQHGGKVVKL